MLDIKFIRENPEVVKEAARKKSVDVDVEKLLVADERRRKLLNESEMLKAEQNKRSKGPQLPDRMGGLKDLKEKIKVLEDELDSVDKEYDDLMLLVPNIPDPSVPDGKSDADNKEIRKWGKPMNFSGPEMDFRGSITQASVNWTGRLSSPNAENRARCSSSPQSA